MLGGTLKGALPWVSPSKLSSPHCYWLTWFPFGAFPWVLLPPSPCWQSQRVPNEDRSVQRGKWGSWALITPGSSKKTSPRNSDKRKDEHPLVLQIGHLNSSAKLDALDNHVSFPSQRSKHEHSTLVALSTSSIRTHLLKQSKVQAFHQMGMFHITTQEFGLLNQLSPLFCSWFVPGSKNGRALLKQSFMSDKSLLRCLEHALEEG